MKRSRIFITLSLLLPLITLAEVDRYNREVIKEYALSSRAVYNIPIGNTPTTITFPGPLTSIDGANVGVNAKDKPPVLLSYVAGRYFFSVRAMQPHARGALNVVYRGQTYAFNFYHHEDAVPYRTVRLVQSDDPLSTLGLGISAAQAKGISPTVLVDLLDRAKSYPLIQRAYPGMLEEEVDYLAPEGLSTEYRDFSARIDEVFRFVRYDTLVFRISLHNTSGEDIFYHPQMLAVRIGENLYYPSIADASGIIPAESDSVAYIAITGQPNGEPAYLSVHNAFQLVVSRIEDPAKLLIP
jgi:hypothetical protein